MATNDKSPMLRRATAHESSSDEDEYYCAEEERESTAEEEEDNDEEPAVKKNKSKSRTLIKEGEVAARHPQPEEEEEERRFDPRDGSGPFTRAEFVAFYGSQFYWDAAPSRSEQFKPVPSAAISKLSAPTLEATPEVITNTAAPNDTQALPVADGKTIVLDLSLSLGMLVANDGKVMQVMAGGQAESLGLLPGCVLFASTLGKISNDTRYLTLSELKRAVAKAKAKSRSTLTLLSLKLSSPTSAEVLAVKKAASVHNAPTADKRAAPSTGSTSHNSTKTNAAPELAKDPSSQPSREKPLKHLRENHSHALASDGTDAVKPAAQTLQPRVKAMLLKPTNGSKPVVEVIQSSDHDRLDSSDPKAGAATTAAATTATAAAKKQPSIMESQSMDESKATPKTSSTPAEFSEKILPHFKVSFSKVSAQQKPNRGSALSYATSQTAPRGSTKVVAPVKGARKSCKSKEILLSAKDSLHDSSCERSTKSTASARSVKLDIGKECQGIGEPAPKDSRVTTPSQVSALASKSGKNSSLAADDVETATVSTNMKVTHEKKSSTQVHAKARASDEFLSAVPYPIVRERSVPFSSVDTEVKDSTAAEPSSSMSSQSDDSNYITRIPFESRTCQACGKLLKTPEGLANHSLFTCPGKFISNSPQRGARFGREPQNDNIGKKRQSNRENQGSSEGDGSEKSDAIDSGNLNSVKSKKQKQSLLKSKSTADAQGSGVQFAPAIFTLIDSNDLEKRRPNNQGARKATVSNKTKVTSLRANASLQAKAVAQSARPGIACARCSWCGTGGGTVFGNDFLAHNVDSALKKELLYFCTAEHGCSGSFREFQPFSIPKIHRHYVCIISSCFLSYHSFSFPLSPSYNFSIQNKNTCEYQFRRCTLPGPSFAICASLNLSRGSTFSFEWHFWWWCLPFLYFAAPSG